MTEGQRKRRAELDARFRPSPRAIETSFGRVIVECLHVLSDGAKPSICLWTDEKKEYARAIMSSPCAAALAGDKRFLHRTISSRTARTRENPLFPVNYLDRELRKDLHEHVRETTCFGRNVNRQMERLSLYLFWHNFRKPHRARGGARSHADVAGYDPSVIESRIGRLWTERAWLSRVSLSPADRETWLRLRRTPLGKERDYLPKYAAD